MVAVWWAQISSQMIPYMSCTPVAIAIIGHWMLWDTLNNHLLCCSIELIEKIKQWNLRDDVLFKLILKGKHVELWQPCVSIEVLSLNSKLKATQSHKLTWNKGVDGRSRVRYRNGDIVTFSWYSSVAISNAASSGFCIYHKLHSILIPWPRPQVGNRELVNNNIIHWAKASINQITTLSKSCDYLLQ